ncbi:MAG: SDR family oxidoreductase [Clostridia bacterium]|nr:SDR family oxidoreductase [Clostridia bacterium]
MYNLAGKVLIVTGAGSGMGRALTLHLIKKGIRVAACDINERTLEETKKLVSDPHLIRTYVADIANHQQASDLPGIVKEDFKDLHGIINNAGIIQPFVKFMELSESAIERVMQINFYGVIDLTRSTIQELNRNTDTYIVNVSSMGGFLPVTGQAIYGASKVAVKLFTEALYGEMKETLVHVSVVFPGAIETNIAANSMEDKGNQQAQLSSDAKHKMTKPDDAADMIIKGIENGKLRIFVGSDAKMMDKFYRLMPVRSIDKMADMIRKMTA